MMESNGLWYQLTRHLIGVALTYLVTITFAAVGWIQLTAGGNLVKFVTPLPIAVAVWILMWLGGMVAWRVLLEWGGCNVGIVYPLMVAFASYGGLLLGLFLLPEGWVTGPADNSKIFVCAIYTLVYLLVNRHETRRIWDDY